MKVCYVLSFSVLTSWVMHLSAQAQGESDGSLDVTPTLDTTTIQSRPQTSNEKVTPDRYYEMLRTTGSQQVNTDRAQADQDAAVQQARSVQQLKKEAASSLPYQPPRNHPSPTGHSQGVPSASYPPSMFEESPPTRTPPPTTSVPTRIHQHAGPVNSEPPPTDGSVSYVDMRSRSQGIFGKVLSRFSKPQSIFKPGVESSRESTRFSTIVGSNAQAWIAGELVSLPAGTRVEVLRRGTERSLVRLEDNRPASVSNTALSSR